MTTEAERLADACELHADQTPHPAVSNDLNQAADELRRLAAEVERLTAELDAKGGLFRCKLQQEKLTTGEVPCDRVLVRMQAEVEVLRGDAAMLDWLEGELEREASSKYPSLFRRNFPITREAIDAAMKEQP